MSQEDFMVFCVFSVGDVQNGTPCLYADIVSVIGKGVETFVAHSQSTVYIRDAGRMRQFSVRDSATTSNNVSTRTHLCESFLSSA